MAGEKISVKAPTDYTHYPSGDRTEDLLLIDSKDINDPALLNHLQAIRYGDMRYGETIFDQDSTLIQEGIMGSAFSESRKKELLGEHIFSELLTHEPAMAFAKGGKAKPKKQSTFRVQPGKRGDVNSSISLYNQWAKSKGLPALQEDGVFDDAKAQAFQNFNADPLNQRKLTVQSTPFTDPGTGTTRQMVTNIGLDKYLPELKIKPLESITGYNKKGEAVYSDQVLPTIRDNATGRLLAVNEDYFPTAVDKTVNNSPAISATKVDGRQAREDSFRNEGLLANLSSLGTAALGGAIAASTDVPRYQPPAEYTRMRDDIYARRNQGLPAEQLAALNQATQQNYANGINTIRQIGGGGASSAAVLASLQGLSSNMDRANLNNALLDVNARQQNQANYQRAVAGDLALDQQLFAADQANAIQNQQNGLAMLAQGVQGLYDQSLYEQQYGPGSIYNDLLEAQLASANNYRATEQQQTAAAVAAIRAAGGGTPITPSTSVTDIRRMPSITIPRF